MWNMFIHNFLCGENFNREYMKKIGEFFKLMETLAKLDLAMTVYIFLGVS
jgi:hypothetical protein